MWKKRGNCQSLSEYVTEITGKTSEQIKNVKDSGNFATPGIRNIASKIEEAIKAGLTICVIGDYDADGICSLAILTMLFRKLGAKFSLTIPKRMSEGYGMNINHVMKCPDKSMILTVDNGITCNEAIATAKARNIPVVVLDHHKGGDVIPDADIIVDPEYDNTGWDFDGYCGAGLSYKLLTQMLPFEEQLISQASAFAAIATLADVVPVIDDNRNIINQGLKVINTRSCTVGLNTLLSVLAEKDSIEFYDEETIKFKIAPIINAPGRLEDNGGQFTLTALLSGNPEKAKDYATKLIEKNNTRKELVETALSNNNANGTKIHWLYSPNIPEGVCGIIAGKLAEDGKPSFVMTDESATGLIKGSARCKDGNNIYDMLKSVENYLEQFGGHDFAAGFAFKKENMEAVMNGLETVAQVVTEADNEYDFEIAPEDAFSTFIELQQLKPFGQSLENPCLKMTSAINKADAIGSEKNHMRFDLGSLKGIGFGLAEKYSTLNSPQKLTIYGFLEPNYFRGKMNPQFRIVDIEA